MLIEKKKFNIVQRDFGLENQYTFNLANQLKKKTNKQKQKQTKKNWFSKRRKYDFSIGQCGHIYSENNTI